MKRRKPGAREQALKMLAAPIPRPTQPPAVVDLRGEALRSLMPAVSPSSVVAARRRRLQKPGTAQ